MRILKRHLRLLPWIGIFALAIALRVGMVFSIGTLWADEAFSWHFAQKPFMEMLHLLRYDVHPPFHAIVLWVWYRLFDSSALVTRLLSLFLAIGGLVTFKLLGLRLFGKRVTILAFMMAAFSPLMIYYSADGRMYALTFFLASFSALAFWEYVHHDSHKALDAWFFTSLALVMTHLTGALVIFAQGGYLFFKKDGRPVFWALFTRFLAMAGLFFVWAIPAGMHKIQMLSGEWQFNSGIDTVPVHEALSHWLWIIPNPPTRTLVAVLAGLLIIGGILRHSKRKPFVNISDKGVFLLWWLLAVTLPFMLTGMTVTPRYLAAAAPALFLLIAFGYLNIVRRKWYAVLLAAGLIVFMTFPGIAALLSMRSYSWDDNAAWIMERYQDGDTIVFGWYANRLPFEAVGGFEGKLKNAETLDFYPFEDDLSWDERYVAHAGTLGIDKEKLDDYFSGIASKNRIFYIPNPFIFLKNGEPAGPAINAWFERRGWKLADHLPAQGRTVGVWLMIRE